MSIFDLIEALIKLGLPMVAISWLMFSWLYSSGEIDREADRKAVKLRLKKMKNTFEKKEAHSAGYVYDKWMWFGSGFYGLAALWTFSVIEISDFLSFIFSFPGFSVLFEDGVIGFFISVALGQLGNLISAFIWFSYWPADSILVWILVACLGYWGGVELARRKVELPLNAWRDKY
ncbi:MAG: hypothetical protein VB962_11770 [Pseudohongiellaceae bacterium]|jgi:hypothetical protein